MRIAKGEHFVHATRGMECVITRVTRTTVYYRPLAGGGIVSVARKNFEERKVADPGMSRGPE